MLTRRRARSARRPLRRRGAGWPATPASTSSTSSTATAISATSCSAPRTARAGTAARSRTARGSCATIVGRHPRHRAGPRRRRPRCRPSTWCRSARATPASACPKIPARRIRIAFGYLQRRCATSAKRSTMPRRCCAARRLGIRWSASPPAARTTTRTSSGRRCSRRATATSRRKIRCVGVARQIAGTRDPEARRSRSWRSSARPTPTCRSGCRNVAQAVVRDGLDRLRRPRPDGAVLSGAAGRRPRRPAAAARNSICRTFSDCTTGPRNGLVSGCYPLDPFYVAHPDAETLKSLKGT